jgi:hypothetical protein
MADFDHGTKAVARMAGRALARVAGLRCQAWTPLESTMQVTTERLADRVFRAREGRERFVVYMEFYTAWRRAFLFDLLEKSAMLSKRELLPTVCLVFLLRRRGYRPQNGRFQLQARGQTTQYVRLEEVPLWQQQPEPWWEESPGLMTLYPLCYHRRTPTNAVQHARRVIEEREPNEQERADLLFLLNLFGRLAYPGQDLTQIIGSELMNESRFLREIRAEDKRAAILRFLRGRFPGVDLTDIEATLQPIRDPDQLDSFIDLTATCGRIDDFRNALQVQVTSP